MTENTATESAAPRTAAETAAQDQAHARRNNLAIILLLISVFVVFLNETLIGVAIPNIMADLGVTPSQGQWLTTAYALTMAVVIPITGYLLQRINTRPVFITAMSPVHDRNARRGHERQLLPARDRPRGAGRRNRDHDAAADDDGPDARSDDGPRADHGPHLDRDVGRSGRRTGDLGHHPQLLHLAVPVLAGAADLARGAHRRNRARAERRQTRASCASMSSR